MTSAVILLSDLIHTPILSVIFKIIDRFKMRSRKSADRSRAQVRGTYTTVERAQFKILFDASRLNFTRCDGDGELIKLYSEHKFDILGSGWVDWSFESEAPGFLGNKYECEIKIDVDVNGDWLQHLVNKSNVGYSKGIWSEILNLNSLYVPIPWNRDMKTGFMYDTKQHFSTLKLIAPKEGVDVKVPWELSRMQHLPVMLRIALSGNPDSDAIISEVKCQVLDFICANPPGYGVNWSSAMEISIRLLNIVVVVNTLSQTDPDFKNTRSFHLMLNSVHDHIHYAWKFRENKGKLSNNHYLANLCGLLYGCYVLSDVKEHMLLFEIMIPEFLDQIDHQFLDDGGNFESSIAYHFLSTEIAILGMSIIRKYLKNNELEGGIGKKIHGADQKLQKAFKMMNSVVNPRGGIVQVGDNDSARMINWSFPVNNLNSQEAKERYFNLKGYQPDQPGDCYPDRDQLNYSSTVEMVSSYFSISRENSIHSEFIEGIDKGEKLSAEVENQNELSLVQLKKKLNFHSEYRIDAENQGNSLKIGLKSFFYPEFGVYIFRNERLFLLINGTNRKVRQYWPHGHNDKLSFELWLDGKPIVRDPGSFIYTASFEKRNSLRSVKAHATVVVNGEEQNRWLSGVEGVFRLKPETNVKLTGYNEYSLSLSCQYRGFCHQRWWSIEENSILIVDSANREFEVNKEPEVGFSDGYGKLKYRL